MSVNQVSPSPRAKPDSDMEITEITEEDLDPGKETDGKHVEKKDLISRTTTFVQDLGKDMDTVGDEMTRFISGKPPAKDAYVRASFCKRENTHARTHARTHAHTIPSYSSMRCYHARVMSNGCCCSEIEPDSTFYMSKEEIVSFHKEARYHICNCCFLPMLANIA